MRNRYIVVAVSNKEKEEVKRLAKESGMSVSEYIRYRVFGYELPVTARRKPRSPIEKRLLFKAIEEELKGKVKFISKDVIEVEPW